MVKTEDGKGTLYRGDSVYRRVRYHLEIEVGGIRGTIRGEFTSLEKDTEHPPPFWDACVNNELATLHLPDKAGSFLSSAERRSSTCHPSSVARLHFPEPRISDQ
jgi:hypothetical protein